MVPIRTTFFFEEWQHFAFVVNPDEALVSLYRNGEVVDERDYDGTDFTDVPNSEALGIGVKTDDPGEFADPGNPGYWNGLLDDLGIWHRVLSADEITQIYNDGLAGLPIIGGGGGLLGDFNENGVLDAPDIDDLTVQSAGGTNPASYDLTGDGLVNAADVDFWISDPSVFNSWLGDANVDKVFSSTDLVQVLAAGKFSVDVDAVWTEGDFDGDGRFNSADLVVALAGGGFGAGERPAPAAVPEPNGLSALLIGLICVTRRRRR